MITRELLTDLPSGTSPDDALSHPEAQAALAMMASAVTCRFPHPGRRLRTWRVWFLECVLLGTSDDDGALIALRAYDRRRVDATTLEQRGLVCAAAALQPDGELRPAVVRGALAWYRALGVTRIVGRLVDVDGQPITGPALEAWRRRAAARVGGAIVADGAGAAPKLVYEVDELERRLES